MNCPKCNSKFIWGNDFDFDSIFGIDDEKCIVSNYGCSKCDVTALIYIPFDEDEECPRCNGKMRIDDYENGDRYSEDGKMPCPDCQE